MPTQRERVLTMLRQGPVCSTTLLEAYIPRGAAVIHKLRREGKAIATRPCTRMSHSHESPQIEYVLEYEDAGLTPGSNNDDVPATPPPSSSTGPGDMGTLFDIEEEEQAHRGPEHWLET